MYFLDTVIKQTRLPGILPIPLKTLIPQTNIHSVHSTTAFQGLGWSKGCQNNPTTQQEILPLVP